jgi:O-antigen ligase
MRSSVWNRGSTKGRFSVPSPFPILAIMLALLLMGMLEVLAPSILSNALSETYLAKLHESFQVFVLGTIIMAILVFLRQDELAAIIVIAIHLYLDWYLGLYYIALIMTLILLLIFSLARSPRYPWAEPRALWLWVLFIVLAIFPATHGIGVSDTLNYYFNIFFISLTLFWLGTVIARNAASVRRFFKMLAAFGTLIAIHTIIQAITGTVLFASSRFDAYFATVSYYSLGDTAHRAGSFLVNPDSSGGFFAMMLFIPLCLFVESPSAREKLFYLAQIFLMLVALLFTYSTGGWMAAGVGILVFLMLVGRKRYRIRIPLFIVVAAAVIMIFFSAQVNLQLQHATEPDALAFRISAWQTGIRVILAFPLTGIGLGRYVYVERAEPYRVLSQTIPVYHPHNSYIEIGALAGLPVLLVFIALLVFAFLSAFRNWKRAGAPTRSLIAGGIASAIALSANSIVVNGWTLIPLAAIGWLILGVISSPLLAKNLDREGMKEKNRVNDEQSINSLGGAEHVYSDQ